MMRWMWLAPLVLGLMTAVGLISALLEDGIWDWASWALLSVPVLVIAAKSFGPQRSRVKT